MSVVPSVSVVIPTYNRRERLHRVLTGLAAQTDVGAFETVVVSDGSDDGTDDYLRGDEVPLPVVALTQPNLGPASARNAGVEAATGELIVFLDDDVVPAPGLLAAHVGAHERHGEQAVVIGPMLDPPDHAMSIWVRYEQSMLRKQYAAMERGDWAPTPRQFYTGNASVRREHVLAAGGFDPAVLRAEDTELAHRLAGRGLEFVYEPVAVGLHYAERSFESWCSIGRAYGRNDVAFSRAPGRDDLLDLVAREFYYRRLPIRLVVRVAACRPRVRRGVNVALGRVARGGEALRSWPLSRFALSGIFNLAYYDGVIDELGGRPRGPNPLSVPFTRRGGGRLRASGRPTTGAGAQ